MNPTTYRLSDLAELTGYPPRTIRSWITAGVLADPGGRGRGAHYGQEHLDRLLFLRQVHDQVRRRLPLQEMRAIFESVPAETVARVARGEEPLAVGDLSAAAPSPSVGPALSSALMAATHPGAQWGAPQHKRTGTAPSQSHWTTIEVGDGVELRMRGDDPERVAWLAKLARRLREWIGGEG